MKEQGVLQQHFVLELNYVGDERQWVLQGRMLQ